MAETVDGSVVAVVRVRLDGHVQKLLPAGTVGRPAGGGNDGRSMKRDGRGSRRGVVPIEANRRRPERQAIGAGAGRRRRHRDGRRPTGPPPARGSIEATAMPTQKRPRTQPVTFVHDQPRPETRHRQPASRTARIVRPIVWYPSGVTQAVVRQSPRSGGDGVEDPDEQAAGHPEQLAQPRLAPTRPGPGRSGRPPRGTRRRCRGSRATGSAARTSGPGSPGARARNRPPRPSKHGVEQRPRGRRAAERQS